MLTVKQFIGDTLTSFIGAPTPATQEELRGQDWTDGKTDGQTDAHTDGRG